MPLGSSKLVYLSRKFKLEVGKSIGDYINDIRIEKAKMLLETTTLSISEIARRLQYCSGTYFGTIFRRLTGKLPSEYREMKNSK